MTRNWNKSEWIVTFLFVIFFTFNFMSIFFEIFSSSKIDAIILVTLPLLYGSFLLNSEKGFRKVGLLFILSSIIMVICFFIILSVNTDFNQKYGKLIIGVGALFFSLALARLFFIVGEELLIDIKNKHNSYTEKIVK